MRKTVSSGLMAFGLAIAIFGAPSAVWAASDQDGAAEESSDETVAEQSAEQPAGEPAAEEPPAEEAPSEEYTPPPAEEYTEPAPEEWVPEYTPPVEEYTEPEAVEPGYEEPGVQPEAVDPGYVEPGTQPEYTEPSAGQPGSDEAVTADEPATPPDAVAPEDAVTAADASTEDECAEPPGRGNGDGAGDAFVGPVAPVGPPGPGACEVPGDAPENGRQAGDEPLIAALSESEEGQTQVTLNEGSIGVNADDPDFEGSEQDCENVTMAGFDAWVFVLPGPDAQWVELEASFIENGTISEFSTIGQGEANLKGVVYSPSGYTLSGADALITGALPGQGEFQLTHTCPGGPPPPPPRCEQEPCTPPPPPPCEGASCEPPPCEGDSCEPPPPPEECDQVPCEEPPGEEPPGEQPPGGQPPAEQPPLAEQPCDSTPAPVLIAAPPAQPPAAGAVAGPVGGFAAPTGQGEETLPMTGQVVNVLVGIGLILMVTGGLALVFATDPPFVRRFHI